MARFVSGYQTGGIVGVPEGWVRSRRYAIMAEIPPVQNRGVFVGKFYVRVELKRMGESSYTNEASSAWFGTIESELWQHLEQASK